MVQTLLASGTSNAFDPTASLELGKSVMTWIMDVIKGEPILACGFVVGILIPVGFAVVRRIKSISK